MSPIDTLKIRLQSGEKILLAGACGTEIQRRGVRTELPLWSASANETHPHVVRELHKDYIDAGAEIITTNTFRTNLRTLRKIDQPEKARELTLEACRLAKEARGESRRAEVVIGGSLAPVEDCYEVNLVPSDEELREEHSAWARDLADGGADFLFVETMNCIREAVAATRASRETGLDVAVSFVCNKKGDLLSGESIESAVQAVLPFEPFAILTNCRPLDEIETSCSGCSGAHRYRWASMPMVRDTPMKSLGGSLRGSIRRRSTLSMQNGGLMRGCN
jgi:homocysteine S-methyltransferase